MIVLWVGKMPSISYAPRKKHGVQNLESPLYRPRFPASNRAKGRHACPPAKGLGAAGIAAGVAGVAGLAAAGLDRLKKYVGGRANDTLLAPRPKPRRLALGDWLQLGHSTCLQQDMPPHGLPLADVSNWQPLTFKDGRMYGYIPQWNAMYCGPTARPGTLMPHGDGILWTTALADGKTYIVYASFEQGTLTQPHRTWSQTRDAPVGEWTREPEGTRPPLVRTEPSPAAEQRQQARQRARQRQARRMTQNAVTAPPVVLPAVPDRELQEQARQDEQARQEAAQEAARRANYFKRIGPLPQVNYTETDLEKDAAKFFAQKDEQARQANFQEAMAAVAARRQDEQARQESVHLPIEAGEDGNADGHGGASEPFVEEPLELD